MKQLLQNDFGNTLCEINLVSSIWCEPGLFSAPKLTNLFDAASMPSSEYSANPGEAKLRPLREACVDYRRPEELEREGPGDEREDALRREGCAPLLCMVGNVHGGWRTVCGEDGTEY